MAESSEIIRKYAVENAINYGSAQAKSVMGKVLAEDPGLKKCAAEVMKEAQKICADVNKLDKGDLEEEFSHYGFEGKKEAKRGTLAELPNVRGEVIMRFAPNPSGPLHIGHARTAVLNDEYVKKHGGKLYLRSRHTTWSRKTLGGWG